MIGTTTPATGYILSVDGKGMFEELKVQLSGNWPDYVLTKIINCLHCINWNHL
jgi:hypothetical protein